MTDSTKNMIGDIVRYTVVCATLCFCLRACADSDKIAADKTIEMAKLGYCLNDYGSYVRCDSVAR